MSMLRAAFPRSAVRSDLDNFTQCVAIGDEISQGKRDCVRTEFRDGPLMHFLRYAASAEEALDMLVQGKVDVALIDQAVLGEGPRDSASNQPVLTEHRRFAFRDAASGKDPSKICHYSAVTKPGLDPEQEAQVDLLMDLCQRRYAIGGFAAKIAGKTPVRIGHFFEI